LVGWVWRELVDRGGGVEEVGWGRWGGCGGVGVGEVG
jgi:hypothetical protein